MQRAIPVLCSIALIAASLAGCGDKHSKQQMHPVKGTVTLDGKPLVKGSIVLDPKGGAGTPVAGGIENGEFKLNAPVGDKIVRISAVEESTEKDQYGEPITKSIIPDNYNRTSSLSETVKEGENSFKFELTTKPKSKNKKK